MIEFDVAKATQILCAGEGRGEMEGIGWLVGWLVGREWVREGERVRLLGLIWRTWRARRN